MTSTVSAIRHSLLVPLGIGLPVSYSQLLRNGEEKFSPKRYKRQEDWLERRRAKHTDRCSVQLTRLKEEGLVKLSDAHTVALTGRGLQVLRQQNKEIFQMITDRYFDGSYDDFLETVYYVLDHEDECLNPEEFLRDSELSGRDHRYPYNSRRHCNLSHKANSIDEFYFTPSEIKLLRVLKGGTKTFPELKELLSLCRERIRQKVAVLGYKVPLEIDESNRPFTISIPKGIKYETLAGRVVLDCMSAYFDNSLHTLVQSLPMALKVELSAVSAD